MEEEIVAQPDSQAETEDTTTSETTVDVEGEQVDWEAKAKDFEAKNKQLFERLKKAEKKPEAPAETQSDAISSKDMLALSGAGIAEEEDIEFLQKAAKVNGQTLAQALKDPVIAPLLKARQEERQTSIATSTGSGRRTPTERSADAIEREALKGNFPESTADLRKMVQNRLKTKR